MQKVIIAAKAENNVLGKDNELLWSLPADEQHLYSQIKKGWLLTGRKSYQSSQGNDLFSGRDDVIILTRSTDFQAEGKLVAHSLEKAFRLAEQRQAERLNILGGARVYEQSMDQADELVITEVHAQFEGDAFFPEIPIDQWQEVRREDYPADAENLYPYSFVWYRRRI